MLQTARVFLFLFSFKQKFGYVHLSTLRTAHCSWDDKQLNSSPRLQGFIALSLPTSPVSSLAIFSLSWFFSLSGIFTAFQEATFPLIQSPVTCSSLPEHSVSFHKPTQPNPSWTPRLTRNHPLHLNSCIFIWQTISLTDWLGVLHYILAWNSVLVFLDTH